MLGISIVKNNHILCISYSDKFYSVNSLRYNYEFDCFLSLNTEMCYGRYMIDSQLRGRGFLHFLSKTYPSESDGGDKEIKDGGGG